MVASLRLAGILFHIRESVGARYFICWLTCFRRASEGETPVGCTIMEFYDDFETNLANDVVAFGRKVICKLVFAFIFYL